MKGVYVLIISVGKNIRVNVGALGSLDFEKGLCAYVGSAQNSVEKRIERHLRKAKRKFWHIDYLLDSDSVKVVKVFCKEAAKSEECKVARELSARSVPIVNFGCSDCSCVSHLFRLNDPDHARSSMAFLTANFTRAVQA